MDLKSSEMLSQIPPCFHICVLFWVVCFRKGTEVLRSHEVLDPNSRRGDPFSYDISLKSLSALNKATCYVLSKSSCGNVLTWLYGILTVFLFPKYKSFHPTHLFWVRISFPLNNGQIYVCSFQISKSLALNRYNIFYLIILSIVYFKLIY